MHVVKQADPKASYMRHRQEIEAAIANVLERGTYLNGPEVLAFEEEFADWLAYDRLMYGVAVSSGTAAIEIALRAHARQSRSPLCHC